MKHCYLFILFLSTICIAQSKTPNYSVKWVNTENGLKQLSVRYCVPDNYGFVWIATELGLYRYDGSNLKEINEAKFPKLNKQRITRLGKDEITGKIYLESNPEGCQYIIDDNKIEKIDSRKYWKNAIFTFNDFCFSDSNPIIKNVYKNDKIKTIIREYTSSIFISACLATNFLYLPQLEHLLIFDKNGLIKKNDCHFSSGLILLQFNETILAADNGKVVLISEGKILKKKIIVDAIFQNYLDRKLTNLSDIEIFGMKNKYFLKYKGEIFQIQFNNNKITTQFLFKNPAEDITSISHLEKENIYLVGTRTKGMAILSPILFNTLQFEERNSNRSINYCYSATPTSDNIWYSASGWNFDWTKGKATKDDFLNDLINTRFILPYKNKFYIQAKKDLWNIDTQKNDYDFIYPKSKKLNLSGFNGYTYHKGQLLLTNSISIYFLRGKNFITDESLNKKFINKNLNGIYSFNNDLIIPTTKGVYKYILETKKLVVIKGLENVNARYIKPINKQSYWVGCYGEGLFLVDKSNVYKVTDSTIELTTAHAIEEDKVGNLWISTNDGLLKTNKLEALNKILNNQPINCYKYSTEDGLITNEFNGSGTHPSLQTKEGIIGFPSMKGFVWFQPAQVPKHLFTGSIVMDKVLVDNQKNIPFINNSYFIPKEAGVISFNFNFGYYYNRENLTISYRFEGQNNWTKIKGNTLQIPRNKKGTQALIIKIATHGFNAETAVYKSFPLEFEARYYETLTFWSFCAFLFALFLYSAYTIGLKLNKRREEHLKFKIEEKTVELQQSINELDKSNALILISLKEKDILLKEIHHRVKNNLQLVMSLLNIQARDNASISIEDFLEKGQSRIASMVLVHDNLYSKENIGNVDFQEYCQNLAHNVSSSFGVTTKNITIEVAAEGIFFDIQTAIPLGLIINELVTNALKHAFPNNRKGTIAIGITKSSDAVYEILVEDNGIGATLPLQTKKSMGLELVSLLVLQLKGTFIKENNNGTQYRITFIM